MESPIFAIGFRSAFSFPFGGLCSFRTSKRCTKTIPLPTHMAPENHWCSVRGKQSDSGCHSQVGSVEENVQMSPGFWSLKGSSSMERQWSSTARRAHRLEIRPVRARPSWSDPFTVETGRMDILLTNMEDPSLKHDDVPFFYINFFVN